MRWNRTSSKLFIQVIEILAQYNSQLVSCNGHFSIWRVPRRVPLWQLIVILALIDHVVSNI